MYLNKKHSRMESILQITSHFGNRHMVKFNTGLVISGLLTIISCYLHIDGKKSLLAVSNGVIITRELTYSCIKKSVIAELLYGLASCIAKYCVCQMYKPQMIKNIPRMIEISRSKNIDDPNLKNPTKLLKNIRNTSDSIYKTQKSLYIDIVQQSVKLIFNFMLIDCSGVFVGGLVCTMIITTYFYNKLMWKQVDCKVEINKLDGEMNVMINEIIDKIDIYKCYDNYDLAYTECEELQRNMSNMQAYKKYIKNLTVQVVSSSDFVMFFMLYIYYRISGCFDFHLFKSIIFLIKHVMVCKALGSAITTFLESITIYNNYDYKCIDEDLVDSVFLNRIETIGLKIKNNDFIVKKGDVIGFHTKKEGDFDIFKEIIGIRQAEVLINNRHISDYSINSVRDKMTYVDSKPVVFRGSLLYNLKTASNLSNSEIMCRCNALDIRKLLKELKNRHDSSNFINAMLDSCLSKEFSPVIHTKINLIRALLRKTDLLLVDCDFTGFDKETIDFYIKTFKEEYQTIMIRIPNESHYDHFDKIVVV